MKKNTQFKREKRQRKRKKGTKNKWDIYRKQLSR